MLKKFLRKFISWYFQLYLKTTMGRWLWIFKFKNWTVTTIAATGPNLFNRKNLGIYASFTINVSITQLNCNKKSQLNWQIHILIQWCFGRVSSIHSSCFKCVFGIKVPIRCLESFVTIVYYCWYCFKY